MIRVKIGWKQLHAAIGEHGNVLLSQKVCRDIADALNAPRTTSPTEVEYANEVSAQAVEATREGIEKDSALALRDHMRRGGDPADFIHLVPCDSAKPCSRCRPLQENSSCDDVS
jgi:hypothetical protein